MYRDVHFLAMPSVAVLKCTALYICDRNFNSWSFLGLNSCLSWAETIHRGLHLRQSLRYWKSFGIWARRQRRISKSRPRSYRNYFFTENCKKFKKNFAKKLKFSAYITDKRYGDILFGVFKDVTKFLKTPYFLEKHGCFSVPHFMEEMLWLSITTWVQCLHSVH